MSVITLFLSLLSGVVLSRLRGIGHEEQDKVMCIYYSRWINLPDIFSSIKQNTQMQPLLLSSNCFIFSKRGTGSGGKKNLCPVEVAMPASPHGGRREGCWDLGRRGSGFWWGRGKKSSPRLEQEVFGLWVGRKHGNSMWWSHWGFWAQGSEFES